MSPIRPIHLVLDFDSTLTKSDTLLPLSNIGYSHPHATPPIPWSDIVAAYLTSLKQHASSYSSPPSSRITLAQEAAWLKSLAEVEQASFERAVGAGIWDGVTREEIIAGARMKVSGGVVAMRDGWDSTVKHVLQTGNGSELKGKVTIVSVNWSRTWIWGCLQASCETDTGGYGATNATEQKGRHFPAIESMAVYANELPGVDSEQPGGLSVSTLIRMKSSNIQAMSELPKGLATRLHTADDKLHCFRSSLKKVSRAGSGCGGNVNEENAKTHDDRGAYSFSVYVGDSTSDFLCLLDADVGICMRDEPMGSGMKELAEVCSRLGVNIRPLEGFDWHVHDRDLAKSPWLDWKADWKRQLWWVQDFREIEKWLQRRF